MVLRQLDNMIVGNGAFHQLRCNNCLADENMHGIQCPHVRQEWERMHERAAVEAVCHARMRFPLWLTERNAANSLSVNHAISRFLESTGMRPTHVAATLLVANEAFWVTTEGELEYRRVFRVRAAAVETRRTARRLHEE